MKRIFYRLFQQTKFALYANLAAGFLIALIWIESGTREAAIEDKWLFTAFIGGLVTYANLLTIWACYKHVKKEYEVMKELEESPL